jgi:hypothetical protein
MLGSRIVLRRAPGAGYILVTRIDDGRNLLRACHVYVFNFVVDNLAPRSDSASARCKGTMY